MGQTNAKYCAMVLAHLYERAMKYAKSAEEPTRSSRDRAIRTALAVDSATAYNYALRTFGHIIADERKLEFSKFLADRLIHSHRKQRDVVKMLDDEGVDAIIEEAYGFSEATLQADAQEKNLELATAFIVAQGQSPSVRNAIKVLAKYKQLYRLRELLKDDSIKRIIEDNVAEGGEEQEHKFHAVETAGRTLTRPELKAREAGQEQAAKHQQHQENQPKAEDILDLLEK